MGKGCGKCGGTKMLNLNEFILKSNKIHNNKYDYSLVNFKNVKTKVKIVCPIHNIVFEQTPNHHMNGVGCPVCNESKGEKEIRTFLEKNDIKYERNKKFKKCRYKRVLPFDFYLNEHNICIEFDGLQHYKPVNFWGGEVSLVEQKERDQIKTIFCRENNIKLIRIKYGQNIFDKLSFLKSI